MPAVDVVFALGGDRKRSLLPQAMGRHKTTFMAPPESHGVTFTSPEGWIDGLIGLTSFPADLMHMTWTTDCGLSQLWIHYDDVRNNLESELVRAEVVSLTHLMEQLRGH